MTLRAVLFLLVAGWVQAQEPVTLASLRYVELKPGTGAPAAPGKRYTVHYTGWLKDGTKFDSSVDRGEPFQFVQGRRQVIAGWDIGFEGMRVGGRRRLIIPYQLAYGEKGTEGIPEKAELTFDVELLKVEDAPAAVPAIDVLVPFGELEAKTVELAKAIPEESFDAQFAAIFGRIASLNKRMLEGATKETPGVEAMADEARPAGKDEAVAALGGSFAAVRKELEGARNGYLGADATLFGKADTRRGLFTALDAAVAEELGRAIEHARANGIASHGIFAAQ